MNNYAIVFRVYKTILKTKMCQNIFGIEWIKY